LEAGEEQERRAEKKETADDRRAEDRKH
jgi:hypothetical protein